jgi:hypothetical protein
LRSTVQIVPGNFFSAVPHSVDIQREGIDRVQCALDARDGGAAAGAFAEIERRHALAVIAMMNTRRRRASNVDSNRQR